LRLGEVDRLGEVLNEARALAEVLEDQRRLGRVLAYETQFQTLYGEDALAVEAGERACSIAEAVDDQGLRVAANYYLGQSLWYAGDPRRAAEALRATILLVESAPADERLWMPVLPAVTARFLLAAVLADVGKFTEALAAGKEGLRVASIAGHRYSELWARYGLGYAHLRHGDFAAATGVLEPGLSLCRTMEFRLILPITAAALGSAYLWSGQTTDGVHLLEEAVEALTAMRTPGYQSLCIAFLAEAYLVVGHVAKAQKQAEQAVAVARGREQRSWEAWALKLLGDFHAADFVERSAAEQAGDFYREALALATELGMRPLVAHCHFGLGKLYRKANEREETREHFTTAITMYREMNMQFWLEKAEMEMKKLA